MYNHFHVLLDLLVNSNLRERVYYYVIRSSDKTMFELFITVPEGEKLPIIRLGKKQDSDFTETYVPEAIDQLCKNHSINILDIIYHLEESVATKYAYLRMLTGKIEKVFGKDKCEGIVENQKEFFKALTLAIENSQKEVQKAKLVLIKEQPNNE